MVSYLLFESYWAGSKLFSPSGLWLKPKILALGIPSFALCIVLSQESSFKMQISHFIKTGPEARSTHRNYPGPIQPEFPLLFWLTERPTFPGRLKSGEVGETPTQIGLGLGCCSEFWSPSLPQVICSYSIWLVADKSRIHLYFLQLRLGNHWGEFFSPIPLSFHVMRRFSSLLTGLATQDYFPDQEG